MAKASGSETQQWPPSLPPPPPPPYTEDVNGDADLARRAAVSDLGGVGAESKLPTAEQAVVHLKLLHAIHDLRNRVSAADGLFGIEDAWAAGDCGGGVAAAKIREKRWAVYVTRAVDRFASWWDALRHGQPDARRPLRIRDMDPFYKSSRLERCTKARHSAMRWTAEQMPQLDILMAWHTYMLNPQCYLEDCVRNDMMDVWHAGFPLQSINACFSPKTGEYIRQESLEIVASGWDSFKDGGKTVECPACASLNISASVRVPWTTVAPSSTQGSQGDGETWLDNAFENGTGWADKGFQIVCDRCQASIDRDKLSTRRFVADAQLINPSARFDPPAKFSYEAYADGQPMAGTVLDPGSGTPLQTSLENEAEENPAFFPNRLVAGLFLQGPARPEWSSMEEVKHELQRASKPSKELRFACGKSRVPTARESQKQRVAVRRMLSRYIDNPSPFALDLIGAVARQRHFADKMVEIDWLHSPRLMPTMRRFVEKYDRFFSIVCMPAGDGGGGGGCGNLAAPTLDVDLLWHTHQLRAPSYFAYSTGEAIGRLVDHEDKIPETALAEAFARTSKTYERLYKEPYSECTCWYCEAVRAGHTSRVRRMMPAALALGGSSSSLSPSARLHDPADELAAPEDPQRAAHVSTHNAVRIETTGWTQESSSAYSKVLHSVKQRLDKDYGKAVKLARKDGLPAPIRGPARRQGALDGSRGDGRGGTKAAAAAAAEATDYPFLTAFMDVCTANCYWRDPGCTGNDDGGGGGGGGWAGDCGGARDRGGLGGILGVPGGDGGDGGGRRTGGEGSEGGVFAATGGSIGADGGGGGGGGESGGGGIDGGIVGAMFGAVGADGGGGDGGGGGDCGGDGGC